MAKKSKEKKPAKKRADKYESKLAISGTLDQVLQISINTAKKPEKKKA
jgi:hypothetical protein